MAKILISGGSGLVGSALSSELTRKGHNVCWLTRNPDKKIKISQFFWNPEQQFIDPQAFDGTEHLVHLAGAGIFGKRWSRKYKQKIFESRVNSSELLYKQMIKSGVKLKSFTGASAVGYYGTEAGIGPVSETAKPGTDFLARVCVALEKSYESFRAADVRTCIIRTAVVLSTDGGALKKMTVPFKMGMGAALGSGQQPFPWIHISDLVALYTQTIEDPEMTGAFNAAAPQKVNNKQFCTILAQSLHKPYWMPNIPTSLLRLILGEAATTFTKGVQVNENKAVQAGFVFRHPELKESLNDLLKESR